MAWLGLLRAAIMADGRLELCPLLKASDPRLVRFSLFVIVICGAGCRNGVVSLELLFGDGGGLKKVNVF